MVHEYVGQFPPAVQVLLQAARQLLLTTVPDAREQVRVGWNLIGYDCAGYFGCIAGLPDRIKIGFEHGAELPDPRGLLGDVHLRRP